jgi:hypothetical protein
MYRKNITRVIFRVYRKGKEETTKTTVKQPVRTSFRTPQGNALEFFRGDKRLSGSMVPRQVLVLYKS